MVDDFRLGRSGEFLVGVVERGVKRVGLVVRY